MSGPHQYGRTLRCDYGTEVEVWRSSGSTDSVWLRLAMRPHEGGAVFSPGRASALLRRRQVEALVRHLQAWLKDPRG